MGSNVRGRTLLFIVVQVACLGILHARPIEELPKWLDERLLEAGFTAQHKRVLGIAIATGRFSRDPILARELRLAAQITATSTLGTGDELGIFGFELQPRECMPFRPIANIGELKNALTRLPYTPTEGTIGGTDIESALEKLNRSHKGAIWAAISPGASQSSRQSGALMGEEALAVSLNSLAVSGPFRDEFVSETGRSILITLTIPPLSSFLESSRTPFSIVVNSTEPKSSPGDAPHSARPSLLQLLGLPLLALLLGIAGGRLLLKRPASATEKGESDPTDTTPHSADLNKLAKRIDLSAQELAEEVERLAAERQELASTHDVLSQLRATRQEMDLAWTAWETAAVEFLDSAQRALQLPDLSHERRETWKRAAADFGRRVRKLGFEIINPEPGSPIEEGQVSIRSVSGQPEVVEQVLSWGYRNGARIIRPAEITATSNLGLENE